MTQISKFQFACSVTLLIRIELVIYWYSCFPSGFPQHIANLQYQFWGRSMLSLDLRTRWYCLMIPMKLNYGALKICKLVTSNLLFSPQSYWVTVQRNRLPYLNYWYHLGIGNSKWDMVRVLLLFLVFFCTRDSVLKFSHF